MPDEITTVDDIVTKAAEKIKEDQKPTGEQDTDITDKNLGGEDEASKAAAAQKVIDDAAAAEKGKQTSEALAELFKEFGVDSKEALKEKLKAAEPDKVLSPEEKEKEVEIYKANVQKYAVEQSGMKVEDFTKLENLKAKPDQELVYEKWIADYKEDNADEIDGNEDWEKEAKESFEKEYKISSEKEAVKKKGADKIAKEAAEIRKPLNEAYEKAKSDFDNDRNLRNKVPEYNKAVSKAVNESIPDKYSAFKGKDGEAEVEIDIEITADDKKEIADNIAKKVSTNISNFDKYNKGEVEEIKTIAKQETERYIEEKYRDEAKQKIADKFLSIGIGKAESGAKAPFALKQGGQAADNQVVTNAKEEVLKSLKGEK